MLAVVAVVLLPLPPGVFGHRALNAVHEQRADHQPTAVRDRLVVLDLDQVPVAISPMARGQLGLAWPLGGFAGQGGGGLFPPGGQWAGFPGSRRSCFFLTYPRINSPSEPFAVDARF